MHARVVQEYSTLVSSTWDPGNARTAELQLTEQKLRDQQIRILTATLLRNKFTTNLITRV